MFICTGNFDCLYPFLYLYSFMNDIYKNPPRNAVCELWIKIIADRHLLFLFIQERITTGQTVENKTALEQMISGLEALPGKTLKEATAIFHQYSAQLYDFFSAAKQFVVQGQEISMKMSDYREILDDYDKRLLKSFGDIIKPEEDILLVCNAAYISKFADEEKAGFKQTSSSVAHCIFRLLIADMATHMGMFSPETSQSIVKSMFMAFPEAAASVFVNNYVTGEYLALPIVLTEKMLQVLPRRTFAKVEIKNPDGVNDASTLLTSAVVKELQNTDLTVETVLGFTIKKFVKYYESLGGALFCKLKAKVMEAFGEHSMSGLAFAGSHVHTCIAKPRRTRARY